MSGGLDALIDRITVASPAGPMALARESFAQRTGDFVPADPFYEERLRAAFDDALTHHGTPRGALVRQWIAGCTDPEAVVLARTLLRTFRALFLVRRVEEKVLVEVPLTGAELCIVRDDGPAGRLREGDLFDGRVLAHEGVRLLPGAVFFERDAHQAILEIVAHAAADRRKSDETCDALLRMQMRLFRQPGLRVHHVYRWDAFDRKEILAAPWARPRGGGRS